MARGKDPKRDRRRFRLERFDQIRNVSGFERTERFTDITVRPIINEPLQVRLKQVGHWGWHGVILSTQTGGRGWSRTMFSDIRKEQGGLIRVDLEISFHHEGL